MPFLWRLSHLRLGNYVLPLGNSVVGAVRRRPHNQPEPGSGGERNLWGLLRGRGRVSTRTWAIVPAGYDGVDNDQDGFIDNWAEGVPVHGNNSALVLGNLGRHTHNTARAEMLYALLVEGTGPLGSVFNRDDFTDKEVQDTDGDGMPEFVDAWGQPLQFFRWPLLYHSDLQRGQNIVPDPSTAQHWDLDPALHHPCFESASRTRSTSTSN